MAVSKVVPWDHLRGVHRLRVLLLDTTELHGTCRPPFALGGSTGWGIVALTSSVVPVSHCVIAAELVRVAIIFAFIRS